MVIMMKLMSGASMRMYSIVAAGVKNDGMVDIIIRNDGNGDADQVLAMTALMMQ
jgi:hypothetical protein